MAWIIRSGKNKFWGCDNKGLLVFHVSGKSSTTNLVFNSEASAKKFSVETLKSLPEAAKKEVLSHGEITVIQVEQQDVYTIH